MKTVSKITTLIVIALIQCAAYADHKEINYCVGAVMGDCIGGNVSIGNASDKQTINEQGILVQNLGQVKKAQTIETSMLLSGQRIIAYTPSQGDYKDRQFKLFLVATDLDNVLKNAANAPTYVASAQDIKEKNPQAKTLFKIFRKNPDEEQWKSILISAKETGIAGIKPKIQIDENGKISYYPPSYVDDTGLTVTPDPITYPAADK